MKDIASSLSKDKSFEDIIVDMYINNNMSSAEISDELLKRTGIRITQRSIQRRLKPLGATRNFSQAFNLAIKKGRKDYFHLRKSMKSSELRKGINLKTRYYVLSRDNYKCVLCGRGAKEAILVVDHIIPVVRGGTNEVDNLRVLCRECNHGKMLLSERS